jgi:hypothetical protein
MLCIGRAAAVASFQPVVEGTVNVRKSSFTDIKDVSGTGLDLIHTQWTVNLFFAMHDCQFMNIVADLMTAIDALHVIVDNCDVDGAKLAYGGFVAVGSNGTTINTTRFANIELGPTMAQQVHAGGVTGLSQFTFGQVVGLVQMDGGYGDAAPRVQGCTFSNITLPPSASQQGTLATSWQNAGSAGFIHTAVIAVRGDTIAARGDTIVAQSSFADCFTNAVVYAGASTIRNPEVMQLLVLPVVCYQ